MKKVPKHPVDRAFQGRLSEYEKSPRETSWERIQEIQLPADNRWTAPELNAIRALDELQIQPKSDSWQRVQAALPNTKRLVGAWFKWSAAAAILLIPFAGWWVFTLEKEAPAPEVHTVASLPVPETSTAPSKSNSEANRTSTNALRIEPQAPEISIATAVGSREQKAAKWPLEFLPIRLERLEDDLVFEAIPKAFAGINEIEPALPLEQPSPSPPWLQATSPWSRSLTAYVATQRRRLKNGSGLQAPWNAYSVSMEVKVPQALHSFLSNTLAAH